MDRLNGFPHHCLIQMGALLLFPKLGSSFAVSLRAFQGVSRENRDRISFTGIPPAQIMYRETDEIIFLAATADV